MEIAQTIAFRNPRRPRNDDQRFNDGPGDRNGHRRPEDYERKRRHFTCCDNICASFSTNDFPDAILVQGTRDQSDVGRRRQHNWVSRRKYRSLEVTLLYIKNGKVVETVAYDGDGNRIVPKTPPITGNQVTVTGLSSTVSASLEVSLIWTSTVESNVTEYRVYKETAGEDDSTFIIPVPPKGAGQRYEALDSYMLNGTFNYDLYAAFPDTPGDAAGVHCGSIENVRV